MARTQLLSNSLIRKSFLWFLQNSTKNPMIQVASCEQALIKTNRKPIQKRAKMLLSKTFTLEFEFDRHLEHMVSYQGMRSGLPVILVGEFGAFEIFMQNDCFAKLDFHISPTRNFKNRSYLDRI